MILHLFHDRRSLVHVACLKEAIEECYGPYGLQVQQSGYLYVPLAGSRVNAARLLKYLGRTTGAKIALWLVDSQLFYPEIGPVMGCSAGNAALLHVGGEPEALAKEALHEVGHLLGLQHCRHCCVMLLSQSPERAKAKPSTLCSQCACQLRARAGRS